MSTFWVVYSIIFVIGAVNLVLARFGGLYNDQRCSDGRPLFGFLKTSNWSANPLLTYPLVGAASGSILFLQHQNQSGWMLLGVYVGTIIIGAPYVYSQLMPLLSVSTVSKNKYFQWNHFRVPMQNANTGMRIAIGIVCYSLGVALFYLSTSAGISILCLAWSKWSSGGLTAQDVQRGQILLELMRLTFGAILVTFVIVRTVKVEMYLAAGIVEESTAHSFQFTEFVQKAKPYFEAVNRGFIRDLVVLALGLATVLFCHVYFEAAQNSFSTATVLTNIDSATIEAGWKSLGWPFRLVLGISIIGFVLPPPSRKSLIGIVVFGTGAWIVQDVLK